MKQSFFFALLVFTLSVQAKVTLHKVFSSNMVLQREVAIPIFGNGDPTDKVVVTFNGITEVAKIVDGKWKVLFPKMKAGGPFTIRIEGTDSIQLNNVMIGDVWVCGGQSNMEFEFKRSSQYANDILSVPNANLRLFIVDHTISSKPKTAVASKSQWQVADSNTTKFFSAVAYYFGTRINKEENVPIGLLQSCWGGSAAELWTEENALKRGGKLSFIFEIYDWCKTNYPNKKIDDEKKIAAWNELHKNDNPKPYLPWNLQEPKRYDGSGLENDLARPSCLYNGMISPISQFPVKGVIWYQGEANAMDFKMALLYKTLFPTMINSWRSAWKNEFPFYFVQLAGHHNAVYVPSDHPWAYLRESQTQTLSMKNTGMASATDVGKEFDIHPTDKKTVGERLALQALNKTYHKAVVCDGPMYKSMKIEGNKAIISFNNIGSGLEVKSVLLDTHQMSADNLKGFEICGEDGVFVWADAKIEDNKVEVSTPKVTMPVAVRYAWAVFPLCNLYNKEGLPAVPFRTDNFEPKGK